MNDRNIVPYYLAFSYMPDIGPLRLKQLIDHFGDVKKAYLAPENDLKQLLGPKLVIKYLDFRNKFHPQQIYQQLSNQQISVIPIGSELYPPQLEAISDPPIVLYLKGDKNIFTKYKDKFFSIVGSRKTSTYGLQSGYQISAELSSNGFIIVSGMALGIDTIAHQASIDNNKPTVAVLGCGVNIIYPPENTKLYNQIINFKGAIISEFPPEHLVMRGLFVSRNRIISGLSKGVLVIEGTERSGALITARYAAEQGRDVFALPSPINSPYSKAPHLLIKQGAKLVTDVNDIIEEYGQSSMKKAVSTPTGLDGVEKQIYDILIDQAKNPDDIAQIINIPITEIFTILTMLELKRIVSKSNDGKYYIL